MSDTETTTQERIYSMIHEMNGWTSPDERRLAQTIAAEIVALRSERDENQRIINQLWSERDEARDEARQLTARCNALTEWGNLLESAAAAHAETGSAWRVAARQLCDALGVEIGDTNDPYAGLRGAIEAVKALRKPAE
jgi:hypothetical protein